MRTVIETLSFRKQAAVIWSDDEREGFIDWIAQNPDSGDVIKDADGARKIRWNRKGTGKSGSARVIYYHPVADEVVLLLMIYTKAKRETVKAREIKRKRSTL